MAREGAVLDSQLRHAERVQQRVREQLVLHHAEDGPRLLVLGVGAGLGLRSGRRVGLGSSTKCAVRGAWHFVGKP